MGELLDFWNGGSNVLIWGLQFGVGKIIWDLISLVCHYPSHFPRIKLFFETGQLIILGLWKSWSEYSRV